MLQEAKKSKSATAKKSSKPSTTKLPVAEFRQKQRSASTAPPKKKPNAKIEVPDAIGQAAKTLLGTLEAVLLNEKLEQIERLPVSQLAEKLQQATGVDTVIFDGIITQRIVDVAADKNIKRIIASRVSEAVKPALNVELLTFQDAIPQDLTIIQQASSTPCLFSHFLQQFFLGYAEKLQHPRCSRKHLLGYVIINVHLIVLPKTYGFTRLYSRPFHQNDDVANFVAPS